MRKSAPLAMILLLFAACGREEIEQPARETPSAEQPSGADAAPPAVSKANAGLFDPTVADEKAPESFSVRFETTKGDIVLRLQRAWAPIGVDRFYNLTKVGYFDDAAFFRVLPGFVAQFGVHGNPEVSRIWKNSEIPDDPVRESNRRGYLTFATAGPNTRTTQLFFNLGDNSASLDSQGFAPIGRVTEGLAVLDSLHSGYGEGAPNGRGPNQGFIQARGNDYLREFFPKLDYIKKATIVQ